jgi:hypothetical protein
MAEAATLEAQGNVAPPSSGNLNQLPSTATSGNNSLINPALPETTTPSITNTAVPETLTPANSNQAADVNELKSTVEQNNQVVPDSGLVFKVQIGAFKDEVPLEIANQFLKIASKGIKSYKDSNGLTIYTLGGFRSYEEALQLRNEIAGTVKDAFIVAYNNGNKISVEEAKTLQGK